MDGLLQDIRFGLRMLLKQPGFTALAGIILAVGIGATSSIFSVVNGVILQPLPYPDPDRLVRLYTTSPEGEFDNWSGLNFLDFAEQNTTFEQVAGYVDMHFSLQGGEYPQLRDGVCVTPNFFAVVGIEALLGRTLSEEIDAPGGERAVVLSYGLWQSQYGADAGVMGTSLLLNEEPYTVVGILPPGIAFPPEAELWASARYRVPDPPFDFGRDPAEIRGAEYFDVIGRLRKDVAFDQAKSEATAIGERLAEDHPDTNRGERILQVPLLESEVGSVKPMLGMLLAAVGLVLLIACANVANLILVRAANRRSEIAVRVSLGAGRLRILRQLITESVLLGIMGGFAGLLLALWGTELLLALAPEDIPRASEIKTDYFVSGFTFLISILAGTLFGLAPALQSFRKDVYLAVREGGGRLSGGEKRSRARNLLVVGELAISLILLMGAGLMIRSLASLNAVDPGFSARSTLSARVWIPSTKYREDDKVRSFYRDVLERVRRLPGIDSAGAVLSLPIESGITGVLSFAIAGRPAEPEEEFAAGYQVASPGYFETLGIPLLRGRLFNEKDVNGAPLVTVISQAFAERYWPGEDPIGQKLTWGDPEDDEVRWFTVVGIVDNTRFGGLDDDPRAEAYAAYQQAPMPFMTLVVQSRTDAASTARAIRGAVVEVDPAQPLDAVYTMEELISRSLGNRRFNMLLMSIFAVIAVLMAGIGLYGVLSYSVTQRSNEIGIRMALGAQPGDVIRQILQEGGRLAALGLIIGTVGAFGLTRLISSLIFGVSPTDPMTFLFGVSALAVVALLACSLPALRATRVDPWTSLRAE